MSESPAAGELLREWRQRRRLSQLDLACEAQVSTRHLSFVETGRARPSRALILQLADLLQLPLRERNRLLLAGGFAPQFPERDIRSPELAQAQAAVQRVLDAHEPFPALAVDRHWNLLLHNRCAGQLLNACSAHLLQPPVNVLRLSLHPEGLAPLIINLGEWRRYLLKRLRRLVAESGDAVLAALLQELDAYPSLPDEDRFRALDPTLPDIAVLLRIRSAAGELALFSTITLFGTPMDITLAELAVEAFFPADAATADRLRMLAAG